jgi:hypothetical protein
MNTLGKNIGKKFHTIALPKIKYLGINLTKYVNDFYKENYKLLKKNFKEENRR